MESIQLENNLKKEQFLSILGLECKQKYKSNENETHIENHVVCSSVTDSNSDDEKNKNNKKRGMKPKSKFVFSVPFSVIIIKESLAKPFYGSIEKNENNFDQSFEVLKKTDFVSFGYDRYCNLLKFDVEIDNKRKFSSTKNNANLSNPSNLNDTNLSRRARMLKRLTRKVNVNLVKLSLEEIASFKGLSKQSRAYVENLMNPQVINNDLVEQYDSDSIMEISPTSTSISASTTNFSKSDEDEINEFDDEDDVMIIENEIYIKNDNDKFCLKNVKPEFPKSITLASEIINIEFKSSKKKTKSKLLHFPIKDYVSRLDKTLQSAIPDWQTESLVSLRSISLDKGLDLIIN